MEEAITLEELIRTAEEDYIACLFIFLDPQNSLGFHSFIMDLDFVFGFKDNGEGNYLAYSANLDGNEWNMVFFPLEWLGEARRIAKNNGISIKEACRKKDNLPLGNCDCGNIYVLKGDIKNPVLRSKKEEKEKIYAIIDRLVAYA